MNQLEELIIDSETFFLPLFEQLRKEDMPVGISEYLLAIKTIEKRIGLDNIERLKRFLCLFWVKSVDEEDIFHNAFEDLLRPELEKKLQSQKRFNDSHQDTPPSTSDQSSDNFSDNNQSFQPSSNTNQTQTTENREQKDFSVTQNQGKTLTPKLDNIKLIFRQRYNLHPRLPISQREMTGVFKGLRNLQRSGIAEELDVEATVNNICKYGFFLRPILKPRRRNQIKLLLLIDKEGSMCPFDSLIKALQISIEKGGLLGKTSTYYFNNFPQKYLFSNSGLTKAIPTEEVLSGEAKNNSVLIVSDAGAARRTYSSWRLEKTREFINLLTNYTYLYAWLNPVPKNCWGISTADDIAKFVPMYSLKREELNDAVKILLGHPFPTRVNLKIS